MHGVRALDVATRDREVVALDRLRDALVHGDRDADVVEDAQGVLGAVVDRDVAIDGRRGDEVQIRMKCREHECDSVVGPCIDVEDELPGHPRSVEGYDSCRSGPRPRRWATAAASTRLATPSLPRMFETWTLAVFRVMNSSSAICWLLRPAATSRMTSASRSVSPSGSAVAAS